MAKRVSPAVVAMVASFAASGCGEESEEVPIVVPLGVLVDCEAGGIEGCVGSSTIGAARWPTVLALALADVNGGIADSESYPGLEIAFRLRDSENSPPVASAHAKTLATAEGVRAIVIDTSRDDLEVAAWPYDGDASNDLNVPLVCVLCNSPLVNNPAAKDPMGDPVKDATFADAEGWNFSLGMSADLQAPVLVRIALGRGDNGDVNGDGQFKIAYYAGEEPLGIGTGNAIQAAALALHPEPPPIFEPIFHSPQPPDDYAWIDDIEKLVDDRTGETTDGYPDVVIESSFTSLAARFTKAYVENGINVPLLHATTFRSESVLAGC